MDYIFKQRRAGLLSAIIDSQLRYEKSWGPRKFTPEYDGWILEKKFKDSFIASVLHRTEADIKNRRHELLTKKNS